MRYVFGFMCACALGVMPLVGCSEASAQGDPCEGVECDDGSECTEDSCNLATGTCEYSPLQQDPWESTCSFDDVAEGSCWDGVC